jgi:hypothetical protein
MADRTPHPLQLGVRVCNRRFPAGMCGRLVSLDESGRLKEGSTFRVRQQRFDLGDDLWCLRAMRVEHTTARGRIDVQRRIEQVFDRRPVVARHTLDPDGSSPLRATRGINLHRGPRFVYRQVGPALPVRSQPNTNSKAIASSG